jgi:LPXTG-motif cell wall-anchored protein
MSDTTKSTSGKKTAGAFDVRVIIGSLLALYGLLLTAMGLFGDPETEKTGGINANLWAGIGLLVVGGAFLLWWRLRPIVVAEPEDHSEFGAPPSH